jgi:hypothetical protein
MGFTLPDANYFGRGALLPHLFTLTPDTSSKAGATGGIFSVALSVKPALSEPPRPLAGMLPYGDRTFLPPANRNSPLSGHPSTGPHSLLHYPTKAPTPSRSRFGNARVPHRPLFCAARTKRIPEFEGLGVRDWFRGRLGTCENLRDVILLFLLKRDYCRMRGADEEAVHCFSVFARDRNGVTSSQSSFEAMTNHYGVRALYYALYFGRLRTVREKKRRVGLGQ